MAGLEEWSSRRGRARKRRRDGGQNSAYGLPAALSFTASPRRSTNRPVVKSINRSPNREVKSTNRQSRNHQMTYLVTGGAGFIGSHLVRRTGAPRRARARRRQPHHRQAREPRAPAGASSSSRATSPTSAWRGAPSTGVDYVLHQAAIPSVPRSVTDPITSNRANIDATLNVLVAARDAGVKRVVYAGSSSAYGDTPTLPKREDMPTRPLSPYALQKLVGEQYLAMFTAPLRARDRHDPLLQRVRPAAGPLVALLGRDLAVHQRARSKAAGRRSTATASRRATSPTSPTWWTACCGRATPPASAAR